MIVILVGPGVGFPNGTATTVRTLDYARAFRDQGHRVLVLCLGPSESSAVGLLNREPAGRFEGIEFSYAGGAVVRARGPLPRAFQVLRALLSAFRTVVATSRRETLEAVIFYSHRSGLVPLYALAAALARAPYVLECCEEPFHEAAPGSPRSVLGGLFTRALYPLFDGALVITDHLGGYVRQRLRRGAPILKVPILVDTGAFARDSAPAPIAGRYLAYSGMLNEEKDGVLTLMRAFRAIAADAPGLRLVLAGDSYVRTQIPAFRAHAEALGIAPRVVFTGLVPRDAVPAILAHAEVLALARPTSRQAAAGFPTKLGEYLATGRPVVVTRVGEIDRVLTDGEDVFFAPPDDADAFAARLRFVLSHPEQAAEVGRRGRAAAERLFSWRAHAPALSRFIRGLGGPRAS